jgi:multidrug efflux pump subunit AcrA (membrane-fusion protein)
LRPSPEPSPAPRLVPAPARRPPSRWKLPLLLAGAGVLGGALYLLLHEGQKTDTSGTATITHTAPVTAAPLERVVRISGQTSARRFVTVMVPVFAGPDSGRDLSLMKVAKAGSFVKKGDLVAEFDPQALRDHIDDLDDLVQQSENDVEKKRADQEVSWETLQQSLRVAKADLDKARLDMKAAEVKTDIERELLKLTADEAEAAYKELLKDVANQKASDRAELRMLEITAARHKLHRGNHVRDLKRFTMRAPMDGLVVMLQTWRGGEMRQIQEGDQVYPGQQFMKIVDPSSMQLEASVSQADSSQFRVGQPATIGLDAFPGVEFKGRIYSIGALAVKGIWETYYIRNIPVRILIEGRDDRLIPDLSAWAHVPVDRQEKALVVPAEAVRAEAGLNVVFVKNGGRFEKRPVEVGLRTPTQVALLSGVRPGEVVALGAAQ